MNTALRLLKILLAIPAALIAFYLLVSFMVRPWAATWGATTRELSSMLPGDEVIPSPATQITLGVTVNAPPDAIWPWLVQMGIDRAGLYTYTWFENFVFDLKAVNADRVHPEWQDLKVGDVIAFTRPESSFGRTGPIVTEIRPNEALVLCMGPDPRNCPGTWQFVLQPQPGGSTRLLIRGRSGADTPFLRRVPDILLDAGYLTMERKMLLGIKARAERGGA